jgi:hypothetical protein
VRSQIQTAIDEKRRALIAAAVPSDVDEIEELSDLEILREHVESLGEVPLIFCLTSSGMACGPVSESVYVGLDLSAAFVEVEAEAGQAVHAGASRITGVAVVTICTAANADDRARTWR